MQPVAQLDQDDPDVLAHRQQHLAQVLHLLFFHGDVLHARELGHALHQVGHRRAKAGGDLLVGDLGILNAVVQQGGDERVGVQLEVGHDIRHRQRVGDIGRAVAPQLLGVVVVCKVKRVAQPLAVQRGVIGQHLLLQRLIHL